MTRREWMLLSTASAALGQTVHEEIQGMAKSAPLGMRYSGTNKEQCIRWQREFRAKLDSLLGSYAPPVQWKATLTRKFEFDEYTREELILRVRRNATAPPHEPRCFTGATRLGAAFFEKGKLFSEEEILGNQGGARTD